MKFKIEGNHLMIYYNSGALKEDATENQNECQYCIYNPKDCGSKFTQFGGQFCDDKMRCKFDEASLG